MKPRIITYQGANRTTKEWSELTGISVATIVARLRKGWSVEKTLSTDVRRPASRQCAVCGNEFLIPPSTNKNACSKECSSKWRSLRTTRHGQHPIRLYGIWCGMKSRCNGTSGELGRKYYAHVSVCAEWSNSYQSFRDWSLTNGYSDELEIDRIDCNGNYEPSNCRWANRVQQMLNTRTAIRKNKSSKYRGVSACTNNSTKKWRATGVINKISKHLGVFETEVEAAMAYDAWARVTAGDFASLNFKDDESRRVG